MKSSFKLFSTLIANSFFELGKSKWSANVLPWMLNFVCPSMPSLLTIYIHLKWIHSCKMFHVAWTKFGMESFSLLSIALYRGWITFLFLFIPFDSFFFSWVFLGFWNWTFLPFSAVQFGRRIEKKAIEACINIFPKKPKFSCLLAAFE